MYAKANKKLFIHWTLARMTNQCEFLDNQLKLFGCATCLITGNLKFEVALTVQLTSMLAPLFRRQRRSDSPQAHFFWKPPGHFYDTWNDELQKKPSTIGAPQLQTVQMTLSHLFYVCERFNLFFSSFVDTNELAFCSLLHWKSVRRRYTSSAHNTRGFILWQFSEKWLLLKLVWNPHRNSRKCKMTTTWAYKISNSNKQWAGHEPFIYLFFFFICIWIRS